LVLLRRDLRLADNPALMEAQRIGMPVEIVLAWPRQGDDNRPGNVAAAWYLNNAAVLQDRLQDLYGISLAIMQGRPAETLRELATHSRYSHAVVNAGHDPPAMQDELELQQASRELGIQCRILQANTLLPIGAVLNKEGKAFRVFSPFHRR